MDNKPGSPVVTAFLFLTALVPVLLLAGSLVDQARCPNGTDQSGRCLD